MVDIIHRIGIKSPSAQVYKALSTINGLAHWWTEEVEGDERIGGKIKFAFRSETGELKGKMVMEVEELNPQKDVRWLCKEGPVVHDTVGKLLVSRISFLQGNNKNLSLPFTV